MNKAFKLHSFILSQQINGITSIYSHGFILLVYPKGSVSVHRRVCAAGGDATRAAASGRLRADRAALKINKEYEEKVASSTNEELIEAIEVWKIYKLLQRMKTKEVSTHKRI